MEEDDTKVLASAKAVIRACDPSVVIFRSALGELNDLLASS